MFSIKFSFILILNNLLRNIINYLLKKQRNFGLKKINWWFFALLPFMAFLLLLYTFIVESGKYEKVTINYLLAH